MRYRIEYVTDATNENSVCYVRMIFAESVLEAVKMAWADAFDIRTSFGANGFQIRTADHDAAVLATERFEDVRGGTCP